MAPSPPGLGCKAVAGEAPGRAKGRGQCNQGMVAVSRTMAAGKLQIGGPRAERGAPGRVRVPYPGGGVADRAGGYLGSPSPRLTALDGRQAREIRQFQAVPTERCYQDRTCRTEYFTALSGPPSGAGTGATALAVAGRGPKRAASSGNGHPPRPSRVGTGGPEVLPPRGWRKKIGEGAHYRERSWIQRGVAVSGTHA